MSVNRIIPYRSFDYAQAGNPSATVNPPVPHLVWLNTSNGNTFICTDNTPGANVWKLMSGFRGCAVQTASNTTIPHDTETMIPFLQVGEDTDGFHDSGTNPSRLTVPAGVSRMRVGYSVRWQNNATGVRRTQLMKNGSSFGQGPINEQLPQLATYYPAWTGVAYPLEVSEGDYYELKAYHTAGTTIYVAASYTCLWCEVIE